MQALQSYRQNYWRVLTEAEYDWFTRPLLIFLFTRLLLLVIGTAAFYLTPENTAFATWHSAPDNPLIDIWARWDSSWYMKIAHEGYSYSPNRLSPVVFFPLYPVLIHLFAPSSGNPVPVAAISSNICFVVALMLLYRLTEGAFKDRETARRTVLYIALFPTSFFFSAVYSESLFLLLAVGAFYFAYEKRWAYAALAGMLASATRIVGVVIFPALILARLQAAGWTIDRLQRRSTWQNLWYALRYGKRSLMILGLIPFGLLGYMVYLQFRFGDALLFLHAQHLWRNGDFTNPLNVIWTTAQDLLSGKNYWFDARPQLIIALLAVAIGVGVWARLGSSIGFYTLLCVLIPLSSSTLGMARYMLIAFPLFMMLGWWGKWRVVHWALVIGFSIGLIYCMVDFVSWHFVS